MPQVQRIDPIVLPSEKESVAAYCRVSTNSADQLNSYHTQIAYYTKLINDNPDWELYDLYADEGITGTSIEKRDEFKRMLADCREGKIKRVLVKSVSRFARNTTELLETTRELKDLGVVVVFEEQGFDTSQVLGEMQLTMFAMVAQEESISTANTSLIFPMKDSALADKLQAIGCGSELPISGVIWPSGLNMLNGLIVSSDELNFLAKSIERFDDSEYDQFLAAASLEIEPDLERLINLSFNINHYTVIRDVSDLAGIGEYHLMNIRGSLSKTELETIDFAKVGRDLLSSGKGVPTEYGLLFENEEVPFRQVYDGTTFPPYLYRGNEVAVVNMHYHGKTDYLYLPEETQCVWVKTNIL